MTTRREISIGIVASVATPLILAMIYWLFDANTHDTELDQRMEPLEARARQEARREIRVLSEKITALRVNGEIAAETKVELDSLYSEQLDMAQNEFDAYDDD